MGSFHAYYPNGADKTVYDCRDGKIVGRFIENNPDGSLLSEGFYDSAGKKDSVWKRYFPNGSLNSQQKFKSNGLQDSAYTWDQLGRIREKGFFVLGSGQLWKFDSLGKLTEIQNWVQGKLHGECQTFFPQGQKHQILTYVNGKTTQMKRWHLNGTLSAEGGYLDGKPDGIWHEWNSLGILITVTPYQKGEIHGERRFYDSTGTLIRIQHYFEGIPTKGSFPTLK